MDAELVYSGISISADAKLESEQIAESALGNVFQSTPVPIYCRNKGGSGLHLTLD